MRRLILLSSLILTCGYLAAIRVKYKVTSMRLNVADIEMQMTDSRILVTAESRIRVPLFPSLNNRYTIVHDEDYRPLHYIRQIHQTELRDSVYTQYKQNTAHMYQKSNDRSISYKVRKDTRDIFSLLAKVSNDTEAGGTYYVDGNGRMWQVEVSKGQTEKISTALGKLNARKHEFSFSPLSPTKAPYIDMITFNFLDPNSQLTLWVSMNGVPLRAHLKKNKMSMSWDIQSVSE